MAKDGIVDRNYIVKATFIKLGQRTKCYRGQTNVVVIWIRNFSIEIITKNMPQLEGHAHET